VAGYTIHTVARRDESMEDLVRVSGLSKRFGMLAAVDGLSFELKKGETLGVLGPNGAGKSTLFNLITGDERASAGSIFFQGQDITRLPAYMRARRGIGRSYQIPRPFGGMTVYENLLVAATFASGKSEAVARTQTARTCPCPGHSPASSVAGRDCGRTDRKRVSHSR
jgi:branched-chain amino acid transport system ATP-binding protein